MAPEFRDVHCLLAELCSPEATDDDDSDPSVSSSVNDYIEAEDESDNENDGEDDPDISMGYSSEAHTDDDSQHSQYNPPSIPELDDGEGQPSKKLEMIVQVMGYEFVNAYLTSIQANEQAGDSAVLEYTIARDTAKLVISAPQIAATVEDYGGAELRHYNRQRKWAPASNFPRPVIFEFKRTPQNVAPQHLAEVWKSLQQRLKWLGVETANDLEKLDSRFLDFVIWTGQIFWCHGRYDSTRLVPQAYFRG